VTTRESRRPSPDQPLRHALAGRLGQNPVSDAGVPPPRAAGVPRACHAAGVAVSPPASVSPPADTQAPGNTAGSTAAAENSGRTPCEGSSAAPAGPPWSKHPGLSYDALVPWEVIAPSGQPGEEWHPPRALTRWSSIPPPSPFGDRSPTRSGPTPKDIGSTTGAPAKEQDLRRKRRRQGTRRFRDARFLRQTEKETVLLKETEEGDAGRKAPLASR